MKNILWIVLVTALLFPSIVFSEAQTEAIPTIESVSKATSSWPRISVGGGYWWTQGRLDMKLYASEPWLSNGILLANRGDKVSELNNELDANLFVVNAEAYLFWRFYVDGFVAWNDFDGSHKDSDWYPAYNPNLMQFSKSDAAGNVRTWDANVYIRLIEENKSKSFLDFGLGYFYYRDDIEHLRNSVITIYDWESVYIPIPGHDSQDKYTFDGFRLGVKARIQAHDRIAIKFNGGFVPWLGVDNNKFWNLRDDLGEPAGLKVTGDANGHSFDLDLGLEFKIFKNFYVEGGFKYIGLSATDGNLKWDWIATPGVDSTQDHWDVDAHRCGFYAMGRIKI